MFSFRTERNPLIYNKGTNIVSFAFWRMLYRIFQKYSKGKNGSRVLPHCCGGDRALDWNKEEEEKMLGTI